MKDQSKLVSVIIPIYNAEKYLRECVESVLNQTYTRLEIIMLDDGSSDNSLLICTQFAEKDVRIRVFHHENMGVSATRNRGIELASGVYIIFVDADDTIDAGMIEDMVLHAQDDSLVVVSLGALGKKNMDETDILGNTIKDSIKKKFWYLYHKQLINPPWNKLYQSSLIRGKIKFDEKLSLGEDLLFNLDYLNYVKNFVFLDKAYYHYRNTGNESLSHKYYENGFQIQVCLFEKLISFCKSEVELTSTQWGELYWGYFKALQASIDSEYEFNRCVFTESMLNKMEGKEFTDVFRKTLQYKKQYRLVSRIEILLYQLNMWKFDYKLRNWRTKHRRIQRWI